MKLGIELQIKEAMGKFIVIKTITYPYGYTSSRLGYEYDSRYEAEKAIVNFLKPLE